jgi:hypothetical protein
MHHSRSYGSSNALPLPRRLKRREGRLWSSVLVVFHKSRPSGHEGHPKIVLSRRMQCRLRAHLQEVLIPCQDLGDKKEEINRPTYTHFSHSLDIIVSAMGDDNQVVGLGIRIGRAKTAVMNVRRQDLLVGRTWYLITAWIISGSLAFGTTCVEPNCDSPGLGRIWRELYLRRTSENVSNWPTLRWITYLPGKCRAMFILYVGILLNYVVTSSTGAR